MKVKVRRLIHIEGGRSHNNKMGDPGLDPGGEGNKRIKYEYGLYIR